MATAAALFQNDKEVEHAIEMLEKAGFDADSITVISKDTLDQYTPKSRPIPGPAGGVGTGIHGPAGAAAGVPPTSAHAIFSAPGLPRANTGFFREAIGRGAKAVSVKTGLFKRRRAQRVLQQANGITAGAGRKPPASGTPDRPDEHAGS